MADDYERLLRDLGHAPLSRCLPGALHPALGANDAELATWIRLELLGYTGANPAMTSKTVVPEYRTVRGQRFDAFGRPLIIQNPRLSFVNEERLRDPVGELEGFVGKTGTLTKASSLAEVIRDTLDVEVTDFRFTPHSVEQVLANIRAQLVDRLASHRDRLRGAPSVPVATPASREEIVILRPSFYGVGINLRALWRRLRSGR